MHCAVAGTAPLKRPPNAQEKLHRCLGQFTKLLCSRFSWPARRSRMRSRYPCRRSARVRLDIRARQRATTRALLIANDFPHTELEQARVLVSRGLARGKLTLLVLPWDGSWRGTFVKFMIPHDARRHTVAPQKRCRSWELMP